MTDIPEFLEEYARSAADFFAVPPFPTEWDEALHGSVAQDVASTCFDEFPLLRFDEACGAQSPRVVGRLLHDRLGLTPRALFHEIRRLHVAANWGRYSRRELAHAVGYASASGLDYVLALRPRPLDLERGG